MKKILVLGLIISIFLPCVAMEGGRFFVAAEDDLRLQMELMSRTKEGDLERNGVFARLKPAARARILQEIEDEKEEDKARERSPIWTALTYFKASKAFFAQLTVEQQQRCKRIKDSHKERSRLSGAKEDTRKEVAIIPGAAYFQFKEEHSRPDRVTIYAADGELLYNEKASLSVYEMRMLDPRAAKPRIDCYTIGVPVDQSYGREAILFYDEHGHHLGFFPYDRRGRRFKYNGSLPFIAWSMYRTTSEQWYNFPQKETVAICDVNGCKKDNCICARISIAPDDNFPLDVSGARDRDAAGSAFGAIEY